MKRFRIRLTAGLMALLMALTLSAPPARASAAGVYLVAANEELLYLTADTMPFWSKGLLYVSSRLFEGPEFEGTDLGITYVRNDSAGLAMLYNANTDLRFDLENQTVYDRQGIEYPGYAIDQGGVVFFPLILVCGYFGLNWTINETEVAPLIRVTSATAILDDASFIDAATGLMTSRYNAYIRSITPQNPPPPPVTPNPPTPTDPPPIQAADGQKIYLVADCPSADSVRALLERLDGVQATFLLDLTCMEDGDLLRGLMASGHGVALRLAEEDTAEEAVEEIRRARELLWQAGCSWLELVWYEGDALAEEPLAALLEETGCVRVTAALDQRLVGLGSETAANTLLLTIGRHREDLSICFGENWTGVGLETLLDALELGQYRLCAWRLTA